MAGGEGQLSPSEVRLLKALSELGGRGLNLDESEPLTGIPKSTVSSLSRLLEAKGLVRVITEERDDLILTDKGERALQEGLPEEKLIEVLTRLNGRAGVDVLRASLGEAYSVAAGLGVREGAIRIERGVVELINPEPLLAKAREIKDALSKVSRGERPSDDMIETLRSRGLAKVSRRRVTLIMITEKGLKAVQEAQPSISRLTHEILVKGEWKRVPLRPYDVTAEPPKLLPARKHPLSEFIEELKDIMVELGFVEVEGPLVEVELFNFDILFQPQDHPAREIQDTLWPDLPNADLSRYGQLVDVIKEVHEKGWGYKWSPEIASRMILRSQTTAVTIRVLSTRPKPPIRFFTVDKVFRADPVDATHLSDFHQLDGIMGWPGYTFRDLLGFLKEFSRKLGLEIKFKPAYFPFTEPSVEGYAKIGDSLVEVFGAGLFRPEVLRMAGVDYPVGAWGMGVERLALARLGLNDVRDLYSKDYEFLSSLRVRV
ncbi:MAG: phenylalanine--tRNA ligase subunit alpha [Acidilobus sp.]